MPDLEGGLTPRRRRPTRWLRRIVLLLSGLTLVAVAAGVIAHYAGGPSLDAWTRARLRSELSRALGRPVQVGSLHVSAISGLVEARDLVVGEVPPSTGRVVEIPSLSATIDLGALLRGRLEVKSLRLDRPRILISRKGDHWEGPFPTTRGLNVPGRTQTTRRSSSLVLRHLEVIDGVIGFEDQTLPLWCHADAVTVGWSGNQRGEGTGTLESQAFRAGSGSAFEMGRLRAEAEVHGNGVSASVNARLGANALSLQGDASFPDTTGRPEGRARVSFHWEEKQASHLAQTVLGLDPSLRGTLEGEGIIQFGRGEWSAEGRVRGTELRYMDLSAASFDGRLIAKPGSIEIRDLEARSFGGRIHGDARLEPRAGGALSASARAEGLSLPDVLSAIGLKAPLSGTGSLKGELTARLGEPGSLRVSATTTIAPTERPGGVGASVTADHPPLSREASELAMFPIAGRGALSIEGTRVIFTSEEARTGSLVSTLRVEKVLREPDVRLDLAADMGSLAEGSALLEAFLVRNGERALPWMSNRLAGRGTLSGQFTFSRRRPVHGTLRFLVRDFAYEGIGAAVLDGTASADGSRFAFAIPRAESGGGVLALEGSFPEGAGGLSRITGTLQKWPLDDVLARLGLPQGASVRGTGPVAYRFGEGPASGETQLQLTDGLLAGVELPGGRFQATLRGARVEISSLTMAGPRASLAASGSYEIDEDRLSGRLSVSRVDATIARPWLQDLPIAGEAAVEVRIESGSSGLSWTARLAPAGVLTFAGRPIHEIDLGAEGDGTSATFEGTLGDLASFSGRVALAAPHDGEGRVDLRSVPAAPLASLLKPDLPVQIAGEIGGQIVWSGPLDDPSRLVAHAVLDQLRLALGVESFETAAPARLTLERGTIRFEDLELTSGASHLRVSGVYPVLSADPIDVGIEGEVDLGAISAFVPELAASGAVRGQAHVTGSRDEPRLTGSLDLSDGRLRISDFPLTADRIRLQARIDDEGVSADSISALLGGGEFLGKGRIALGGDGLRGFSLAGRVTNVTLALPEGFRGQYSGSLEWQQANGQDPVLAGSLDLIRGIWRQDFGLDKLALGGRVRAPVFQVSLPSKGLQRTVLDLRIGADDNVWCRNDLADVEGRTDLHLGGTIARPELTGRFEAFEGGEMRFRRVRYQIDQGIVDFPPGPVNPEYDISAETHVSEYDIRMHLWGDLNRFDFELTSNPPLTQQQILSLLVTGATNGDENALDRPGLPGTAASVVGGEIGSLVGERLERWLGFEEIRIEPLLSQGSTTDPTTRVTLGKKLSPRIFVKTSVSLNAPEDPIYQVEYALSRNLRLLLERGDLGSLGGDIRYSTRFFSFFANRGALQPEANAPRKKRRIAEIRLAGDPSHSEEQLRRKARVRVGSEFSRRAMVEGADRLKRFYVKQSYLEASVRPSARDLGDGRMSLDYEIDTGPKLMIRLEGAGVYEARIRKALESFWTESAFGGDVLEDAEDRIRRLLQDEGYYACFVSTRIEDAAGTKLVTFRIDPGEKVIVQDVRIEGTASVAESEVRKQVLTGQETLFRRDTLRPGTLSADIAAVENLYRSRGFLKVQARSMVSLSSDGRRAFVTLVVTEGPASRLRKVDIVGMSALPRDRGIALLESRPAGPFLPAKVLSDKEAIRRLYDEEGYPEIKVEEAIVSDGEDVDLTYRVTEGERRIVHAIQIEGNALTKDVVIRREVPFAPGQPISAVKMRDTRQRLLRTGLFTDVQVLYENEPDLAQGQVLKIRVREAESLVLGLGAGYDSENGPRGSALLANTNLLGRGLYAGISALYGSKLERAQVSVKNSRLFQSLWGVTLSSFYEKRERASFSQRQIGNPILFERRTNSPLRHYFRLSSDVSEVFDVLVPESTFRQENYRVPLGRLRLVSAGYAIVRDTRNDPLAATRGSYSSIDLRTFGGRAHRDFEGETPVETRQRFTKMFLQGNFYRPLPLGFSWSSSARLGVGWRGASEPIPLQERYFAGGDSTVRGFGQDRLGYVETERERLDIDGDGTPERPVLETGTLEHETLRPLGGESLLILNNELRHRIVGSLFATTFLDAGNVYPRATDITRGRLRTTAGLGLRLDTSVGPLRLEYGRKLDRQKGESPGEFVLSLGQSF